MSDNEHENELPRELALAVDSARQRTVSTASVNRLQVAMSELDKGAGIQTFPISSKQFWWRVSISIAASLLGLLAAIAWQLHLPYPGVKPLPSLEIARSNISSIRLISFEQSVYQQVQEDLDVAQKQADSVSEKIALANIRFEIIELLDDYYEWKNRP